MEQQNEQVEVHEGRPTGTVISVRLRPEEADLLDDLAERHGLSLSDTVREGLLALRARDAAVRQAYTASVSTESLGSLPRDYTDAGKTLITSGT